MKIFYVYTALTTKGGADRILIQKANWLAEHGHDVTFVTDSQIGRKPAFPLSPRVQLHDFALDFGQEYGHGLLVRTWWYFRLMRKFRRMMEDYLRQESPDVVITTMGRDLDFLPYIADGSVKVGESHTVRKYSRNFHLLEQRGGLHKLIAKYWRKKQERDASHLDALVLLTRRDAASWEGVTRTFVIPNSLTIESDVTSTCENKKVIFVGRLSEEKGHEYMIDAWQMVSRRFPDWTLEAYGDGELREELVRRISERGLSGMLHLNPATPDIKERYLESSICVMTSRYEGFGLVLLEAMTCGVPCVAFDCPCGPADVIKDGEDGFLVEHLNVAALADKLSLLMENKELRQQFGRRAYANIQRYQRDRVMGQWVDLFETLVKEKRQG